MENKNILYNFDSLMQHGLVGPDGERQEMKKVVIPMIQRPYAQGRKSRKDIREQFITDIFRCITSMEPMELNFVYGTLQNGVFELLDGQQRLTTLFLLHWYISTKDDVKPEYLSKFTYETRTSSTNFIHKLVEQGVALNDTPSKEIRAAYWYSKSFDKDTTIDAMLRMLDCIDEHYMKTAHKPTYADLSKLQFYVLELNGFGLTEELFIKMNARGLQLTPFENFKADLVGYLKKQRRYQDMFQKVPYWLHFSSMLDGAWQDIFWEKPAADEYENSGSRESDRRFFRFIQRYLSNKFITLNTKAENIRRDATFRFFTDHVEIERHEGFDHYKSVFASALEQGADLVKSLAKVLNFIADKKVGAVLLDELQAPWADSPSWKPWDIEEKVSQRDMIRLAAMTEYVEQVADLASFDITSFKRWMRIVHNLVANTDINGEEAQITLTRLIKDFLMFVPEEGTSTLDAPYQNLIYFNQRRKQGNRYLEAEALKARAILKDSAWEEAFIEAEKDKFMRGFVTFYYEEGMTIEKYRARTSRMPLLFDAKGVAGEFRKDFLLMRAFYARMYDWTNTRKDQWFFNVTNDLSNRDLKNQTIWNESPAIKSLFCSLLDGKDAAEIKEIISSVIEEEHPLLLKESYWDKEAVRKLNTAYRRLFRTDEMDVLKWLYERVEEQSMRIFVCDNGTTEFYKGTVNCMVFSDERHRFIPALIEACGNMLDFQFLDKRQKECWEAYHNYNGNVIRLQSHKTLGEDMTMQVEIRRHNEMIIFLRSGNKKKTLEAAKKIYEHFRHLDNGHTLDKNGQLIFNIKDNEYIYRALLFNYSDEEVDNTANVLKEIKELIDA